MDKKLPAKTAKITSLENLYVYDIYNNDLTKIPGHAAPSFKH